MTTYEKLEVGDIVIGTADYNRGQLGEVVSQYIEHSEEPRCVTYIEFKNEMVVYLGEDLKDIHRIGKKFPAINISELI